MRLVSAVLAYAQREEGWITTNPAERVTMPTVRRDEMLCISEPEVMTLAATFEHAAYQTMIRLTVFGGARSACDPIATRTDARPVLQIGVSRRFTVPWSPNSRMNT